MDNTGQATAPAKSVPQKTKCRTQMISDNPADADEFGPHQKIADAIYDLIQTEKGGVAIGLEGDWGSGKSTVVRLLEAKLKQEQPRLQTLVLFNAWAHEGDPLRRTFLESLIQHLIKVEWVSEEEWYEELEIIGRRKEKKRTRTDPQLTRLGKFIGLSLLFIPLGVAFLGEALERDPQFSLSNYNPYLTIYFSLGLLFTLCPLWLYIFSKWGLFRSKKIRQWLTSYQTQQQEEICRHSTDHARQSDAEAGTRSTQIEHLLLNKVITEEHTVTTKTPDPTAIEFEETFKHLMSDALKTRDNSETSEKGSERRIVLVLDNLDRIAASEALSIWSTLQTFLKQRQDEGGDSDWFKRVWIIVPYDRSGLSALWEKDRSGAGATAASFMDKSFQVRFEVPEPVRSEWRSFLVGKLKEAFPDHDGERQALITFKEALQGYNLTERALVELGEALKKHTSKESVLGKLKKDIVGLTNDTANLNKLSQALEDYEAKEAALHTVYRVMALELGRQNKIPTIRELKLCVNQMGSIHRQWCEGFPLSHLAYFVMLRRPSDTAVEGIDIAKALLDTAIVEPQVTTDTNAPATSALATTALSPSFPGADIVDLLDESVGEIRDNLAALCFNVDKKIAQQLLLRSPIINALSLSGVEDPKIDTTEVAKSIEDLRRYAKFMGFWFVLETIINEEWTRGEADKVARAAYCLKESGLLEEAGGGVSRSIIHALNRMAYKVGAWAPLTPVKAAGMAALFSLVNNKIYATALLHRVTLNLVAADQELTNLHVQTWTKELRAVQAELVSLNQAEAFIKGVFEPLSEGFRQTETLNDAKYIVYLEALFEFSLTDPTAKSFLDELATKGDVLRQLGVVAQRPDAVIAWCTFALLRLHPQSLLQLKGETPLPKALETRLETINKEFVLLLIRYGELSSLFDLLNAVDPLKSLSLSALRELSWHDFSGEPDFTEFHLDADLLPDKWPLLETGMSTIHPEGSELFTTFIKFLVKRTDVISEIEKSSFDEKQIHIYEKLYEHGEKSEKLRSFLITELESVTQREWREQLLNDGLYLNLALHVSRIDGDGRALLSGPQFQMALADYANEVAVGNTPSPLQNNCAVILGKETVERNSFRQQLLRTLGANAGNISADFFKLFDPELSDTRILAQEAGSLVPAIKTLFTTRNLSGLQWLSNFYVFDWLNESQLEELREAVLAALSVQKDDAAYPYLLHLVEKFDSLSLGSLDEVDFKAAEFQLLVRKMLEVPDIPILNVLKAMRDKRDFYSPNEYLDRSTPGKYVFANSITDKLSSLETSVKEENKVRLETRLLDVLNNIIKEREAMPPVVGDGNP